MTSTIACGSNPLDEAFLNSREKLKIPQYNKMDKTLYGCYTVFSPDKMVIRQWDGSLIGKEDIIQEEWVAVYYFPITFVELEKGKVYEFAMEWDEKNFETNGFWGNASYVFMTE